MEKLLSDNGSDFISNITQNVCKVMGVKKIEITPHNSRANGISN